VRGARYTVERIAERCWGVTERGGTYPGHIFPTKRQAEAFADGRCEHCGQRLSRRHSAPAEPPLGRGQKEGGGTR